MLQGHPKLERLRVVQEVVDRTPVLQSPPDPQTLTPLVLEIPHQMANRGSCPMSGTNKQVRNAFQR